MTIQEYAAQRGINVLLHFTRVDNLDSIMRHGLCLPTECVEKGITTVSNDGYRLDGTDSICVSIAYPNYKMFFRYRCENPTVKWVILVLRPAILWETDCAFCVTNAASNTVTSVPLAQRRGVAAFEKMYDAFEGKVRADLQIPERFPTNPQAEVLLLEGAPRKYIAGLIFDWAPLQTTHKAKYENNKEYPGLKTYLYANYFKPRIDYVSWPKNG